MFSKNLITLFPNLFHQIVVGDLVREFHNNLLLANFTDLVKYVELHSLDNSMLSYEKQKVSVLQRNRFDGFISIPTSLILNLIKFDISRNLDKSYILDGFGRTVEQILMFENLNEILGLKNHLEILAVIHTDDELIKFKLDRRRICPVCKTPKYLELIPSTICRFDNEDLVMYCDNEKCIGFDHEMLIQKEGDNNGFEAIRDRVILDRKLIDFALNQSTTENFEINCMVDDDSRFQDFEIAKIKRHKKSDKGISVSIENFSVANRNVFEFPVIVKEFLLFLNDLYDKNKIN